MNGLRGCTQTPKSPMPRHRGGIAPIPAKPGFPISRIPKSRPNRDSPFPELESRNPGQIGIGAKSRLFSRSRPNRDRENPGYFPGQIGAGRGAGGFGDFGVWLHSGPASTGLTV